jgi:hypothetical protein
MFKQPYDKKGTNKGLDDTDDFDNLNDSSRVGLVKGFDSKR